MICKNLKLIFFVLFYFFIINVYALENKIISKINNQIITSLELKNKVLTTLILANEQINQDSVNKTKPLALRTLTNLKLKNAEIIKYKINVSDQELDRSIQILAKNNLDDFLKKFENYDLNFELYKNDLKVELGWKKLVVLLYNDKVKIDESELKNRITEFKNKKIDKNIEYKLSEIILSFDTFSDKKNKIDLIKKQIIEFGFESTALKYSESFTNTKKGDLGWVNSKALSDQISIIIRKMDIGDISEPIENLNNILILKLTDKRITKVQEENIDMLRNKILEAKKNELFNLYSNSHLSKLRNTAIIEYK